MPITATWRRLWRTPLVCAWITAGLLLAATQASVELMSNTLAARTRPHLTRLWMRGLVCLLPLEIRHVGTPVAGPAVWTSNHISWLDIVVLGAHSPLRFLSKAEVARWPIIGWLATAAGTLYLRRGDGMAGELDKIIEGALEQGERVVIFAEGTTTDGSLVRTFHGRLLGSAVRLGLPVQPVAIAYRCAGQRDSIAPFIADDEFTAHLWRLLGAPRIEVEVTFPEALPSGASNRNQLARQARQRVVQALGMESDSAPTPAMASAA